MSLREKLSIVHPQLFKRFYLWVKAGCKIDSFWSHLRETSFFSKRVWRSLNLSALSRAVEVLMKNNWEAIGAYNEDTLYYGSAIFPEETAIRQLGFLHLCSSVILDCSFLFLWHLCLALVLGWWCPHRMSLAVYLPLQFSGRVWVG